MKNPYDHIFLSLESGCEWSDLIIVELLVKDPTEFFTVYTKLAGMALLYSKDLTTSSGAQSDARDYY